MSQESFFIRCLKMITFFREDAGEATARPFPESREVKRIFAKEGTKKSLRKKAMKKVPERNRSSHFKCINSALIVHNECIMHNCR